MKHIYELHTTSGTAAKVDLDAPLEFVSGRSFEVNFSDLPEAAQCRILDKLLELTPVLTIQPRKRA